MCSEQVQQVLIGSRKPSIRATYLAKWQRFSCWAVERSLSLTQVSLQSVLEFLLHLKLQGLSLSSRKVHLAAVSVFHPPNHGRSVFAQEITGSFIKGLERLYAHVCDPSQLVLSSLSGPPIKTLALWLFCYSPGRLLSWR